jgi:hypothetical protein
MHRPKSSYRSCLLAAVGRIDQHAPFEIEHAATHAYARSCVGLKKIAEIKANSYYTSSATLGEQLAAGDVWMSVWTSGRAWAMIKQGYPVGYVHSEGGQHPWHRHRRYGRRN